MADSPLYGSSDQRELELREIDKYDSMNPELFYDYVERLERANDFLKTHITNDRSGDLRRSLLDYSGLAGGETNFWANPYEFSGFDKRQADQYKIRPDYADRKEYASMQRVRPYDLDVSAKNMARDQYPTSRLLPHEMSHTKEALAWLNSQKGYGGESWMPNFSDAMYTDLEKLTSRKGPYYRGHGMGSDPGETMGYLRGREGELRKGKTLMDDPETGPLFKKYPGAYEEYQRASKVLKQTKGKR